MAYSLTKENIATIVEKELTTLKTKFKDVGVTVDVSTDALNKLINKCYSPDYGARYAQRIIISDVEDLIVNYLVENDLVSGTNTKIFITLDNNDTLICQPDVINA